MRSAGKSGGTAGPPVGLLVITLTPHLHVIYTDPMKRRAPLTIARIVVFSVAVSFLAPALACASGMRTAPNASACCRAMRYTCHKAGDNISCCQQRGPLPVPPALAASGHSTYNLDRPITFSTLAAPPNHSVATGAPRALSIFAGLSPPGREPLFLLHSSLLI